MPVHVPAHRGEKAPRNLLASIIWRRTKIFIKSVIPPPAGTLVFPPSSANGRRCRAMQCVSFLNHFIPKARLGQIAFGLFICETVVLVLVSEIGLIFLRRRRQALTERDRVRHRPFFGGRRGDGVGGSDERHNHRDAQKWPNDTSRTCTK